VCSIKFHGDDFNTRFLALLHNFDLSPTRPTLWCILNCCLCHLWLHTPYHIRCKWWWLLYYVVSIANMISILCLLHIALVFFILIQVKCVGSNIHDADFTTSYSYTTWPRLSTSTTLRSTIWIWFFVDLYTYTLSYTMLLMVLIILLRLTLTLSLSCLYCYYETGDFDSLYTTYFIGSIVNILSSSNNNDNHISTSQLMFEQLLIAFQQ